MVDAIGVAASGLAVAAAWMDTTAANIANDVTPGTARNFYRAEVPVIAANGLTGGVSVVGVARRRDPPSVVSDPGNPSADRHGLVTYSNVDLSVEIPNLMMASAYSQANVAVIQRAQAAYQSVIQLGQLQP